MKLFGMLGWAALAGATINAMLSFQSLSSPIVLGALLAYVTAALFALGNVFNMPLVERPNWAINPSRCRVFAMGLAWPIVTFFDIIDPIRPRLQETVFGIFHVVILSGLLWLFYWFGLGLTLRTFESIFWRVISICGLFVISGIVVPGIVMVLLWPLRLFRQ